MKSSRYNIILAAFEGNQFVLFNTLYGSMVLMDKDEAFVVKKIMQRPKEVSCGDDIKILRFLSEKRFIVDSDLDEIGIVKNRKLKGVKDKNRADIIIMPTMDCNFNCPYCYEKHDSKSWMSKDVENSLLLWIDKILDFHKVLLLSWFGGEPLIKSDTIFRISEYVNLKCKERGVSLISNVTTNGYLFDNYMIKKMIDLEIYNYQITVDGPPDIHNKTRVLRSGFGSFDKVFANIVSLAQKEKKVKISLRINYNHNNLYHIAELLPMFPEDIRSQLRVVCEPVFGHSEISAIKNISCDDISMEISRFYENAKEMGYDVVLGGLGVGKLVYCYAERESQYIINYNGDVFKCSVGDFSSASRVGYINKKGDFVKDKIGWKDWFSIPLFEDECEQCIYLPICMGGCRKDRIENKEVGSYCALVPTNTSYVLKEIAFGAFNEYLKQISCELNPLKSAIT